MKRLEGKSALITGSARGIGKTFARAYLAEGASVAIADINLQAARATAQELGDGAYPVDMDVTDQASIDAAMAAVVRQAGKLDILINNAALFTAAPITDIRRDDFDKVYAVNVGGTLFTLQAAAKQMIAQGHGGRIINMASQAGRARGEPAGGGSIARPRRRVISITQSAGLDLIKHGINVNAISPGVVDGEHWEHVDAMFAKWEGKKPGQKKREVGASVPFGRFGTAQDLVGMAIFPGHARGRVTSSPRPTMSMAATG